MNQVSSFGEWLRRRRRALDWTQEELAHRAGCAVGTIRKLEADELRPSKQLAEILAQRLDVPPSDRETFVRFARGVERHTDPALPPVAPTETLAPPPRDTKPPHNLPAQLTNFIGREREMAEVRELLASSRLLTLIGSGGAGKTRLALQVAADKGAEFADGIWFVELAPLTDPTLIPQTVASVLGLRDISGGPLMTMLSSYLRSKTILLLLDNCEHLVEGSAKFVEAILHAAPKVSILATSREALGITGERTWRVPSLSLPDPSPPLPPLDRLVEYAGVRLFVERARGVSAEFTLTEENASSLVQICQRLDGIPLAIELAAARVKTLSLGQIALRLDDRFNLLTQGSRTALRRHQTLRATMDWSYDLLSEREKVLFRRLSVFAGGWTLEAAEAVGAGGGIEQDQVLESLSGLTDKSLVIAGERDGMMRYRMLETIREYAREKLSPAREADAVNERHLEYFRGLAEQAEPHLFASEATWFYQLETDIDNFRAAVQWAMQANQSGGQDESSDGLQSGLRLAAALAVFWESRYPLEGATLLKQVLTSPGAKHRTVARARALNAAGLLEWSLGNLEEARVLLEEALSIGREMRDQLSVAWALVYLGAVANFKGDYAEVQTPLQESIVLAQNLGAWGKSVRGFALFMLGDVPSSSGDYERAKTLYEESATVLAEVGNGNMLAYPHRRLGYLDLHEGDLRKACELIKSSFALNREVGNQRGTLASIAGIAAVCTMAGDGLRAAKLFAAVDALLAAMKSPLFHSDRVEFDRYLAQARTQLGEATFAAAWSEGREMSMEQAVGYALAEVENVRESLKPIPNNLPVPLSSFVGRRNEIDQIKHQLTGTRLLTLTGAGGVGKTRLALKVAAELVNAYKDGVWWIDLVAVTDPALVPHSVASALGVREVPRQPVEKVIVNDIRSKQMLLVFDNCEHLVEECARLAAFLLGECPHLRIMTTSREAIGITGETAWRVPSLSLPDLRPLPSARELLEYEGIRLFVERARSVKTDFKLLDDDAQPALDVCQRLDGMPLAIELAAARVKTLSVRQIAERLDNRFELLTKGSRAALPRHQTLRATIDWSYDLLTDDERALFRRLSVFAGGWTLEAAEVVCAGDGPVRARILELLSLLVDKSLVIMEEEEGVARYRMLQTIHQYAHEKLAETEEEDALHRRHLEFFVNLVEEAEPRILGTEQVAWFKRLEAERSNWQGAIDWALEHDKADDAMRIAGVLVLLWFSHGPPSEGQERLRKILSRPEAKQRSIARARALNGVGPLYWNDPQMTAPRAEIEEALAIGQELGDQSSIANSLRYLGLIANLQGQFGEARAFLEQSLQIERQLGPAGRVFEGQTLSFLGNVALNEHEYAQAQAFFEASIVVLTQIKDKNFLAYSVRQLGHLARRQGQFDKAAALCKESLSLNAEIGDQRAIIACLGGFAAIAGADGRARRAAKLFGAVDELLNSIGARLLQADSVEHDRNLAMARAQLDERAFDMAWAEGRRMSIEQATAYASDNTAGD